MKAMRFVLIVAFLFTFVTPVRAQAGERYGFIPLVKKADPKLPLWVQAQDAFERLLPQLMQAKRSGTILEFEPEFSLAVVRIKYVAGANGLTFGRETVFSDMKDAIVLTPHGEMTDAQSEVYSPVFKVMLWQDCVEGNVGKNSRIVANMQNQAGVTLINYVVEEPYGYMTYCFRFSKFPDLKLQPGYKLTYKIYDTLTGVLRGTYQTIIPDVKFTRFDKKNNLVRGTGPAGRAYSIEWFHYNLDADNTFFFLKKKANVAANGTWQMDFGSQQIRGGDRFMINANQNANFTFIRYMYVPYVYCEVSSNFCIAHGIPFNRAVVTIIRPGFERMFEGKYDEFGSFEVELKDDRGDPVPLAAGDQISATGITSYALPRLDITRVPGMTTVSGVGPPNKHIQLVSWWGIYHFDDPITIDWIRTNADGTYTSTDYREPQERLTYDLTYRNPSSGNLTRWYDPYRP